MEYVHSLLEGVFATIPNLDRVMPILVKLKYNSAKIPHR
jgi:hypothetical protein